MPDPSSALARLRRARRRRSRRVVTRAQPRLIVLSGVPADRGTRADRVRAGAWTLYSRWEWARATARAERARRRAHPPWG